MLTNNGTLVNKMKYLEYFIGATTMIFLNAQPGYDMDGNIGKWTGPALKIVNIFFLYYGLIFMN